MTDSVCWSIMQTFWRRCCNSQYEQEKRLKRRKPLRCPYEPQTPDSWFKTHNVTLIFRCTHTPISSLLVSTTADIMEDELMFSMEEVSSAKRPPVQRSAPNQRTSSLSDANASDDDDDDGGFICSILDDNAKDICHYMKSLVYSRQLSNSLPKTNFLYKVSHCPRQQGDAGCIMLLGVTGKCVMKLCAVDLNYFAKHLFTLLFCVDTFL